MQLEVGKTYLAGDGYRHTIVKTVDPTEDPSLYDFGYRFIDNWDLYFTPDGRFFSRSRTSTYDIIGEMPEGYDRSRWSLFKVKASAFFKRLLAAI